MPRLPPALALALAACLVVPAACADGGHSVEGHLRMPGVAVDGHLDLEGAGLFEMERQGGDAGIAVSFTRLAQGNFTDRTRDKIHLGLSPGLNEPSVADPQATSRPIAADGAGRIENVRCGPECRIAVAAEPGDGTLGVAGDADATLRPTAQDHAFSTTDSDQVASMQWTFVVPAGSVEAASGQFADPEPRASGRVTLVIADAAFDLVAGGTRTTVDARWWNETLQQAAGRAVTVRHHGPFANLTLDGAALDAAPGAPFRLSFPTGADGRLEGALSSPDASGVLAVAGRQHDLDHDGVLLEGALAMRLAGTPHGPLGEPPASDAEVWGRATTAVVSGVSVMPHSTLPVAAKAGGGLLALVGLAALGRLFLAPLYHRLGPSDLLANPNRRRIFEIIRERPGVDVGTLVAAAGLSRILVRHHLRMLEAHGLVRATVWRRRRTYALAGAGAGLAACELKDATRRRVASAVAESRGATQKDLARALGLSQRLVSYHLARLAGSSLVRIEGRNPRVYLATPALACALANEAGPSHARGEALSRALGKDGEGAAVGAVAS